MYVQTYICALAPHTSTSVFFKIKFYFFFIIYYYLQKKYNLLRHYLKCITTPSFIARATLHAWEPWYPVS